MKDKKASIVIVTLEETYVIPHWLRCGFDTIEELLDSWFNNKKFSADLHHASRDTSVVKRKFVGWEIKGGKTDYDFSQWFNALLMVGAKHGEHGLDHPMGACCYRDVLRDKKVKAALEDAWERIIINGEEVE